MEQRGVLQAPGGRARGAVAPGRAVLAPAALATCSVWVAVDDSRPENGCMRYLPGSHAARRLYRHEHAGGGDLVLNRQVSPSEFDPACARDDVLRAGELSSTTSISSMGPTPIARDAGAPGTSCATCRARPSTTGDGGRPELGHRGLGLRDAPDLARTRGGPDRPQRLPDRSSAVRGAAFLPCVPARVRPASLLSPGSRGSGSGAGRERAGDRAVERAGGQGRAGQDGTRPRMQGDRYDYVVVGAGSAGSASPPG